MRPLPTDDVRQLRDRGVLVLGWAMMVRRGTLAALEIGDVARAEGGLDVTSRQGKADQDAEGHVVAVPYGSDPLTCPVRITLAWIELLLARCELVVLQPPTHPPTAVRRARPTNRTSPVMQN
jgi:hypothetical protein